jgi:hypothetical protein
MGKPGTSEIQAEIFIRMERGWKLQHVNGEFPFTWLLVPPHGKGGTYDQNSPVKALLDIGVLTKTADGTIVLTKSLNQKA